MEEDDLFSSCFYDVFSHLVVSDSLQSLGLLVSSVHGISPGKNTGVDCHFLSPGDLPDPGIEPMSPVSPALQADSLPAEPSGKSYKYQIRSDQLLTNVQLFATP